MRFGCSMRRYRPSIARLFNASGLKILEIYEARRRGERRFEVAGLAHEGDHLV